MWVGACVPMEEAKFLLRLAVVRHLVLVLAPLFGWAGHSEGSSGPGETVTKALGRRLLGWALLGWALLFMLAC